MEYGLIGKKLGHSFSKIIHNRLCDYDYQLKELEPDQLDEFFAKKEFKAINVTIPYKTDVIKYLDSISDVAKTIGAVNTIVNKNGKLYGYNTDFYGMRDLLQKHGIDPKGKYCAILGTGGTSKTAKAVLESLGAKEIVIVSRKSGNGCIDYEQFVNEYKHTQIIINTTPCGMYPNISESAVDISGFDALEGVADAVYNPLNSLLVVNAKERGINATGGLYMLVSQAVYAVGFFCDKDVDTKITDTVFNELKFQKQNIVLCGMAGCGKSTLGKIIANKLGLEFYDSDDEIVKVANKSIPEIFAESGEAEFRKIESQVIFELSKKTGVVIATGGGAVLKEQNVLNLKQNGAVIYLDRPLADIKPTPDRPLSQNREQLEKLYNERKPIYNSVCDIGVAVSGEKETCANAVIERYINEYNFKKM